MNGKAPSLVLAEGGEQGIRRVRVLQWSDDGRLVERAGGPSGGELKEGFRAGLPAVVLSPDGGPLAVAYRDGASIQARRFRDGAFQVPGAVSGGNRAHLGDARVVGGAPSVAMRAGQVVVAFASDPGVTVWRHQDGQWTRLPDAAPPPLSPVEPPRVVLDSQGRPVVAWSTHGGTAIVVRRFDGGAWQDLGASLPGTAPSSDHRATLADLLVDATDAPVVAWSDPPHALVEVTRLEGAAWKSLLDERGAVVLTPPALALDAAGRLLVARLVIDGMKYPLYVRRQSKDGWEYLPSWTGTLPAPPPRLFLAVAGAEPVVAFQATPAEAPWVLAVKGASWEALSTPERKNGLQPGGAGALVLDDTGAPIVAYSDPRAGEVGAMRYGNGWISLAGADSISASDAPSLDPAMATSGDTICVAWTEPAGGAARVLLRCHRR